jgi:hypothetical protein
MLQVLILAAGIPLSVDAAPVVRRIDPKEYDVTIRVEMSASGMRTGQGDWQLERAEVYVPLILDGSFSTIDEPWAGFGNVSDLHDWVPLAYEYRIEDGGAGWGQLAHGRRQSGFATRVNGAGGAGAWLTSRVEMIDRGIAR